MGSTAPATCPPDVRVTVRNVPVRRLHDRYAKRPRKKRGRADLVIIAPELAHPVRIECKWQQTRGSADEKLVYLLESCKESDQQQHVVILCGGRWVVGRLPGVPPREGGGVLQSVGRSDDRGHGR